MHPGEHARAVATTAVAAYLRGNFGQYRSLVIPEQEGYAVDRHAAIMAEILAAQPLDPSANRAHALVTEACALLLDLADWRAVAKMVGFPHSGPAPIENETEEGQVHAGKPLGGEPPEEAIRITELGPRAGRRSWLADDGTHYAIVTEVIIDGHHFAGLGCAACREWDCAHVRTVQATRRPEEHAPLLDQPFPRGRESTPAATQRGHEVLALIDRLFARSEDEDYVDSGDLLDLLIHARGALSGLIEALPDQTGRPR